MYAYMYAYACMYVCIYVYVCIYMYTDFSISIPLLRLFVNMFTYASPLMCRKLLFQVTKLLVRLTMPLEGGADPKEESFLRDTVEAFLQGDALAVFVGLLVVHIHIYIYMYIIHLYTYTHTYIYTYIHITYTYKYTYIHT